MSDKTYPPLIKGFTMVQITEKDSESDIIGVLSVAVGRTIIFYKGNRVVGGVLNLFDTTKDTQEGARYYSLKLSGPHSILISPDTKWILEVLDR